MLKYMAWRFFKDLQELKILETSYYYCDFMTILRAYIKI